MGFRALFDDMNEVRTSLSELLASSTAEEEAASRQIAQSASAFSRTARAVVDDKLSFSATLMRAGEVTAATRLLAEVEEVVRSEEVALIETVNEVKVAQAIRRGRITRLRLARSLAAAMLGACVLAFSAVGIAVAGAFRDNDQERALASLGDAPHGGSSADEVGSSQADLPRMRRLQIGDVRLVLTAQEFRQLTNLTGGDVDEASLTDLLDLLEGALADKVQEAIAIATEAVGSAPHVALETAPMPKDERAAKDKSERPADEPAGEPQPTPSSEPEQDPEPEPEPSPSPSESDESEQGEGGQSQAQLSDHLPD